MAAVLEVVPRVYEGGIGVNGELLDSVVIGSSMCTSSSDMTTEPGDGVFSRHTVHKDGVIFRQKPIVGKSKLALGPFILIFISFLTLLHILFTFPHTSRTKQLCKLSKHARM